MYIALLALQQVMKEFEDTYNFRRKNGTRAIVYLAVVEVDLHSTRYCKAEVGKLFPKFIVN